MTGPSRISHNLRFVAALLPPLALLAGTIAVVTLVDARIPGALGLALGLIAGGAGVLGVLLAYWNVVDWSNLAIIRRSMNQGDSPFEDGTVIAFEGRTCTDGPPIYPPFSATPCVAYTYVVSGQGYARQGERRRVELAQGFHLVKTRIDGGSKSLALGSFPSVEDDLREDLKGAFVQITNLLLGQQIADFRIGRKVTYFIHPDSLSKRVKEHLAAAMKAIDRLRDRVRAELTGNLS